MVEPSPSLIRDPVRAVVVAGAVVAIVASPMPWLVKVGNLPAETVTGWSGFFDGFLIAIDAAVLAWLVLSRDAVAATTSVVRWMPSILAVTAVVLGMSAVRDMQAQIEIWAVEGATGEFQPALAICLAGVGLLAAGTLVLGVRTWRSIGESAAAARAAGAVPTARLVRGGTGGASGSGAAVAGTIGALAGIALAVASVVLLRVDPIILAMPLLLASGFGGIAGAHLGVRIHAALFGPGTRD